MIEIRTGKNMKILLVLAFVAATLCDNSTNNATTTMAPSSTAATSMSWPAFKNLTEINSWYEMFSASLFNANQTVAWQSIDPFLQGLLFYKSSLCYEVYLSNMTYMMIDTDNIDAKCELASFMAPTMAPTTTTASVTTSNETETTTTAEATTTTTTNSTTTVAATTANTTMSTAVNSTTAMPGNATTAMPNTTMAAANTTTTTMATPAPETGMRYNITGGYVYIKDNLKTMYEHNYTCYNNETCNGFYIASVSMDKSILPPIAGKEVMDKIVCVNIVQPYQPYNFSTIANFSALLTVEILFTMSVPQSSKCVMFDMYTKNATEGWCTSTVTPNSIRCKCSKLGIIGVAYLTPSTTTSPPNTTVATTVNVNTTATPTNSTASMMNTTVQVNTTVAMNVTTTTTTTTESTATIRPVTTAGSSAVFLEVKFTGRNCTTFMCDNNTVLMKIEEECNKTVTANDANALGCTNSALKSGSIIYTFFIILKDASIANSSVNNIGNQVKNGGFVLTINGETLTADTNGFKVEGQQYVVYATDPPTQPEEDDNDYIIVIIVVTIILVLGIIIIIVVVYIVRDKSKQKVKPDSRKN